MSDKTFDPTYLGASEAAWYEGFEAGSTWQPSDRRGEPTDPPRNPYTEQREHRLTYVRGIVDEMFGRLLDEDGDPIGDDYLEAMLDAHADWLAGKAGGAS